MAKEDEAQKITQSVEQPRKGSSRSRVAALDKRKHHTQQTNEKEGERDRAVCDLSTAWLLSKEHFGFPILLPPPQPTVVVVVVAVLK